MDIINVYAILPLIAVIVFLLMVAYLLIKVPFNDTRNTALAVMFTLMTWAIGETILKTTDDENTALMASKILITIGGTFIGAVTLQFALTITGFMKTRFDSSVILGLYLFPIYISVIRAATSTIISGVSHEYFGYSEIGSQPYFWVYASVVLVYMLITLYIFYDAQHRAEGKTKRAYQVLLVGITIPLVFGAFSYMVIPLLGLKFPETTMTSTVVFAIAIAYAIKNLEVFEVTPTKELGKNGKALEPEPSPFEVPNGRIYFLDEHKPEASVKVFATLVFAGRSGLAIVRMSPKKFRDVTGLKTTPVIWLATQEIPGEQVINPSSIPRLFVTISEFLASAKQPVILLEGLETMIFVNNFREVMGFISSVYEKISVSDGILLIPFSKATMTEPEWALLTKHMDELSHAITARGTTIKADKS